MTDNALGEFLRSRRSSVHPADVGFPGNGARRVAGLRREEVAVLAGVSVDYYARLEQGRERHPSGQVVDAIARALKLDDDAHWHVYRLAGLVPAQAPSTNGVAPSLLQLVNAFPTAAAHVTNRRLDILAMNALAKALYAPLGNATNMVRSLFEKPASRTLFADWDSRATCCVAALRLAVGQEPEIMTFVEEFRAISPEFSALWKGNHVARVGTRLRSWNHPDVGPFTLTYQTFDVQDAPGQTLWVGSAEPGSADALALARLAGA